MYIVVVGGGQVGYYLSRALVEEGHELLVVEKDAKKCAQFEEELGSICLRGDGCEATILTEVGTERADIFIAVTDEDEDNLVACQVAKHKFKVPRTIARINNPKNEAIFKKLGIDVTVSSTNLILEHIEQEVPTHPLMHLLDIEESGVELLEVKVHPGSAVEGRRVGELPQLPHTILALIIRRGHRPIVPKLDTMLEADDQLIVLSTRESEAEIRSFLTGVKK